MNPAAHRVPIKDGTAHLDAIWRGLSYAEMVILGKQIEAGKDVEPGDSARFEDSGFAINDPDSLI